MMMHKKSHFQWWLIYLFTTSLGILVITSHLGQVYNPVLPESVRWFPLEQDSFFHARRILDAAKDLGAFYEFDPKIQAPEGAWLSYPWLYDYGLGLVLKFFMWLFPKANPVKIMNHFPLGFLALNNWIFLALTGTLELKPKHRFLAALCFILLPLNVRLHMLGHLDHHAAEYTFVLLTLWLGLEFFKCPHKRWPAVALGLGFALAPGVQCGLIVLQAWFLMALFLEWCLNGKINQDYQLSLFIKAFSLGQVLVLLPSEPFRKFMFFLHFLSWFHALVAVITVSTVCYLRRYHYSKRHFFQLLILLLLLSAPAWVEFNRGLNFIANRIDYLVGTEEMKLTDLNVHSNTCLVLLHPLSLMGVLFWSVFFKKTWRYYGAIHLLGGFVFFLAQRRFHYYGNLVLFLPLVCWMDLLDRQVFKIKKSIYWYWGTGLFVVVSCVCAVPWKGRGILLQGQDSKELFYLMGHSWDYHLNFDLLQRLQSECQNSPGLVLAQPHLGNYIRFHTNCSVLSTRMLIAEQDFNKARRTQQLLGGSLKEFLKAKEPIKYILTNGRFHVLKGGRLAINRPEAGDDLETQLLYGPVHAWEKQFQLIGTQWLDWSLDNRGDEFIFSRLFKVRDN